VIKSFTGLPEKTGGYWHGSFGALILFSKQQHAELNDGKIRLSCLNDFVDF